LVCLISHFEPCLLMSIGVAEEIFAKMTFKNIAHRSGKRSFYVEQVNGNTRGLAKFDSNVSSVKISNQDTAVKAQDGPARCLELTGISGIDQPLEKLNDFLANFHRKSEPIFGERSCGVLLHGGHGTGKTYITERLVQTGWGKPHFIEINAKTATIVETFKNAKLSQPSIVVIDELESIVSKDDSLSQMNAKTLGQELDNLILRQRGEVMPQVLVVATTLNPSDIPISLKKKRRFHTQIALSIPDASARRSILRSLNPKILPGQREEILDKLGDRTHAYTAEDLYYLLSTASVKREKRHGNSDLDRDDIFIEQEDIEQALLEVRPTAMHDITLQPPSVRWDDIGGQDSVKKALRLAVESPIKVS
jgi:AAA family ATPase